MLAHARFQNTDFTHCTLLKASKSKKLLSCPADSADPHSFYLVKMYFYPGLLQTVKYLFRRSKGHKELALAKDISRRGIPTIVPKEVRDIKKWGLLQKSVVLTEQLPDCLNLEELLLKKQVPDRHLRRKIIEEYGKLARLIHDQGIYQDDFDPNNILYEKRPNGAFQLYFLDFERTRIVKEIPPKTRIHLLAKLNRMGRRLKKTDQMRFLKAYLGPQTTQKERHNWIRRIKEEEETIFLRDQRKAWKECTSSNSRIGIIKYGGYQGYYRKKHHAQKYYTESDVIHIIQAIEEKKTDKILKKHFPDPFFSLTVELENRKETFQVRFFQYGGLKYRLQRTIKQTPLLAAWKMDNGYLKNRSADFLPVAALEKKTGPDRYHGFLIRKD